ncbi:hypothetical protein [Longispora albida]|uniref:hypothetical protein n=1 Tax=Longispora albida TaxID=203523 RepID=UPI000378EB1D|nr:hypothetical protein [Longispora albida]
MVRGFGVDAGQLDACRDQVTELKRRAAEIIKLAVRADPADGTWGLLGQRHFEPGYEKQAAAVFGQLRELAKALQDRSDTLGKTSAAYKRSEQAIAEALQGLATKLERDR